MKSIKEVLIEYEIRFSDEGYEGIEQCFKIYAEQFIDKAIEEVKLRIYDNSNGDIKYEEKIKLYAGEIEITIDENSILKLKEYLK